MLNIQIIMNCCLYIYWKTIFNIFKNYLLSTLTSQYNVSTRAHALNHKRLILNIRNNHFTHTIIPRPYFPAPDDILAHSKTDAGPSLTHTHTHTLHPNHTDLTHWHKQSAVAVCFTHQSHSHMTSTCPASSS